VGAGPDQRGSSLFDHGKAWLKRHRGDLAS
jgi:hypothetical protein